MRNKGYDSIWNASRNAVLTIFSVLASGYNFVIDDYKLPLRINPVGGIYTDTGRIRLSTVSTRGKFF